MYDMERSNYLGELVGVVGDCVFSFLFSLVFLEEER